MVGAAAALVALATLSNRDAAEASSPGANGLIAYVKAGPACPAPECGEALWVAALDGTRARRLKVSPTRILSIFAPTWSPDGKSIAYFDFTGGGVQGDPQNPPLGYELWVINADGSGRKRLIDYKKQVRRLRPSWTPNSRELTFQTDNALWAIDGRTRRTRKLAALPKMGGSAQLSPDGKHIAYTDAAGDLFVMSSRGGGQTRLARISTWAFNDAFDWSPDSRKLAVLVELGRPALVSITGGPVAPLVEGLDRWERPVWSPDGSTILTQRQQYGEPDPDRPGRFRNRIEWDRFATIKVDGGEIAVVGPGTGSCSMPGRRDAAARRCKARDPSWQPRR